MDSVETLTKADLAKHLMDKLELGKKEADLLVQTFLDSVIEALRQGDGVELRGFGSFWLRERKGRKGSNTRSGESIEVTKLAQDSEVGHGAVTPARCRLDS